MKITPFEQPRKYVMQCDLCGSIWELGSSSVCSLCDTRGHKAEFDHVVVPVATVILSLPTPLWLLGITWLRTKEDTGVGDTVERALSYMGGDQFKWMMNRLGINCGCEDRKQYLNRVYPYES